MKKLFLFMFLFLGISIQCAAIEYVNMKVGESKTLYLPSSVTSKYLKSVNFLSYGIECVQVASHSTYSVTIKALKPTPSAGVIVRCDYTYYVLRNGRYVYGGRGAYDYNVKVAAIEPTSVTLPNQVTLEPGQSKVLTATVSPSNATTELTWESSVYSVVNVWQNGKILAQKPGSSTITVTTSNGKKAQCKVTVVAPDVMPTSVSISSGVTSLFVGDVDVLTATVLPSDATDKSITWSSSNPSIVSVSSSGVIKGLKAGYATITVRTCNGLTATKGIECKDNLITLTLSDADGCSGSLPSKANVNYERTFQKGWNTMCVPFAVTESMLKSASQGLRLAKVKEIEVEGDRRNIVLLSIESVKAGEPALVYATAEVKWKVSLNAVDLTNAPVDNTVLKGCFIKRVIGAGCLKIAADGESFGMTKSNEAVAYPFRCYIKL